MTASVNGRELTESEHAKKQVLIDTMILCYAHDRQSQHNPKASLIMLASIKGTLNAHLTY